MKLLAFLLFLLLAFLLAPARHHARRPGRARPVVRVLRSPQAPKVVRRVAGTS